MITGQDICQYLAWDSTFFGYRIARMLEHRLTPLVVDKMERWCTAQRVECLYFLAASDDSHSIRLAENEGFHLVDIRMTFRASCLFGELVPDVKPDDTCVIRKHHPDDIPALKDIARSSHHASRFYVDGHFALERCHQLYEIWIDKSCTGDADVVLVAEYQQQPVGYVSCHIHDQGIGQIGLVGVSASIQRQGIGTRLIQQALHWFTTHECQYVDVVTQGRNLPGQRLYQRCGFVTQSVQLFYHKWF